MRPRILSLLFAAALAAGPAAASAQTYPSRPLTLIVSFPPGGITDVPARILAADWQQRLGQPIVVENKPGASGVTGGSYVWRAEPDGYTLLVNAVSEVQNLHYIPVPYNAVTDFANIGKIADGPPVVLIVNAATPFKSLADVIAAAKANPAAVNFSSSGPATSPAIAISHLNQLAGTKIAEVPYRGSAPAATAVMAGEVQGSFVFYLSAKQAADEGRVRVLAVAGAKRLDAWPDAPTMEELGYKGFDYTAFVGLAAPKGTPPQILATLNKALNEAIRTPAVRQRLDPLGLSVPAGPNTPAAFTEFMKDETARQATLAKLTGHSLDPPK